MECHGTHMTRFGIVAIVALVLLSATALPVQAQEDIEEESNVIIDVVLPVSLAFIMFSLGIGLTLEDFSLIFREPKAFGIGMANQMVVLPLMGFAVATLAGLEGELAVGLIILACCPGGVTSNIITKLARGDTALSISYTAVVSVVTVISLPIIVGLSMDHFMGGSNADFEVLGGGVGRLHVRDQGLRRRGRTVGRGRALAALSRAVSTVSFPGAFGRPSPLPPSTTTL